MLLFYLDRLVDFSLALVYGKQRTRWFSDYGLRLRLVCPVLHILPGSVNHRFSTNWLSGFGLISDGMVGALYLLWEIESMHSSVEGLCP